MVSGITLLKTSSSKWDRENELCELLSLTSRIYLLIPLLTEKDPFFIAVTKAPEEKEGFAA